MIVFVHGVPETAAIWRKVRAQIDRDSVAVSLPGFGCPRPDGFGGTKDDYVDWLLGELAGIGDPIDLVGHDWGAGLTLRIATAYGDRVRSWAADVAGIAHPDYVWHDIAKVWQTPGEGEAFVATTNAMDPKERAGLFEAYGIPADDALEMATASDATMGESILGLYRSALPNPYADWGPLGPTKAPGLVLHPTGDPFAGQQHAAEVAELLGARFAPLEGVGHWWPYQAPEAGASALTSFWASLD